MPKPRATIVMTTVPDDEQARRIARVLVEEGLAGCVQRLSIRSTYRWKDAVEDGHEVLLLIKTPAESRSAVERRIGELTPYEVPEVIAVDAGHVAPAYAAWLTAACKRESSQ